MQAKKQLEKNKMNLIETIQYLKENENNRVKGCEANYNCYIYKFESDKLKFLSDGIWYESCLNINSTLGFEIYKAQLNFKDAMSYLQKSEEHSVKCELGILKLVVGQINFILYLNNREANWIRIAAQIVDQKFEVVK